jgi:hypothetical protein
VQIKPFILSWSNIVQNDLKKSSFNQNNITFLWEQNDMALNVQLRITKVSKSRT